MRREETGSLGPRLQRPNTLAAQAHSLACDGKGMLFTGAWSRWKGRGAMQHGGGRAPTCMLSATQQLFNTGLKSGSQWGVLFTVLGKWNSTFIGKQNLWPLGNRPSPSEAVWHKTKAVVCPSLSSKRRFCSAWFLLAFFSVYEQLGTFLVAYLVKNQPANAGDACRFDSWWWRFPGEGNGNPLWCSCLENPTFRGAWQATVHVVAKRQTWLSAHSHIHIWTTREELSEIDKKQCVWYLPPTPTNLHIWPWGKQVNSQHPGCKLNLFPSWTPLPPASLTSPSYTKNNFLVCELLDSHHKFAKGVPAEPRSKEKKKVV